MEARRIRARHGPQAAQEVWRSEDLISPSRRGRPRNANHALRRFLEDLERIGLRARRQHDARRTFISIARADGARPDILRWAAHGPTGDITNRYTTLPWGALCDEVAKLRIEQLEGQRITLPVAIDDRGAVVVQSSKSSNSDGKLAERTGLEPCCRMPRSSNISRSCSDHAGLRAVGVPARPS